jgi:hypothetical protein
LAPQLISSKESLPLLMKIKRNNGVLKNRAKDMQGSVRWAGYI